MYTHLKQVLERVAKEVREGKKSIWAAVMDEDMDWMTLKRYIDKEENEHVPVRKRGSGRVAETHKVLPDDPESELAKHINNLVGQFNGLSSLKCREPAYYLAHRDNIPVPDNWSWNGRVSDIEQRYLYLNVGIQLRYTIYCTTPPIPFNFDQHHQPLAQD